MMNQTLEVMLSSKYNDWHTPEKYLKAVRAVLGAIDLDPASCETANCTVSAARYYTEAENGLLLPWAGRVFVNPPYGKVAGQSSQELFILKLIKEVREGNVSEAIALVNFVPGYKWFKPLWDYPICSVDHCIKFVRGDGAPSGKAKASSCFVYFGEDTEKFITEFSQFGPVIGKLAGYIDSCIEVQHKG